jgi:uncharacterized membrane-anchored protein YhcB (DUF1043 family)
LGDTEFFPQESAVGIEIWIVLLLAGCAVSGWVGYAVAARGRPTRDEVKTLEEALEEARAQAETVQANVNEHFEQSAVLFGRLAKDYREFLDHFSDSAKNLGLSEGRARELLERGFRPVLTHEAVAEISAEAEADEEADEKELASLEAIPEPVDTSPEPPVLDSVVEAEATADEPPTENQPDTAAVGDVLVEMPDQATGADTPDTKQASDKASDAALDTGAEATESGDEEGVRKTSP